MLGGSFDPVHIGHLFIAEEARVNLGYERIIFVPAYQPPHKDGRPEADDQARLAMLRFAIAGRDDFEIETYEIDRGGVSYTIDTVGYLESRLPVTGKLGMIIGDDLVDDFHTWKNAEELKERVDIVVATRQIESADRPVAGSAPSQSARIDNSPLPVSSSEIRMRVREGRAFRYLVPERVHDYIVENGLYTS
jgi:nicotinate-nucleotide adenylyltransferase